jgi:hypothetical protein
MSRVLRISENPRGDTDDGHRGGDVRDDHGARADDRPDHVAAAEAVAGAEREQREGASGKWVAHWKMVHIVRPVWERVGHDNQLGRAFPPLTHTDAASRSASQTTTAPSPSIRSGPLFHTGRGCPAKYRCSGVPARSPSVIFRP